jgi:hypothetical protein
MSSTVQVQPSSFTEEKFAIVSGLMIATVKGQTGVKLSSSPLPQDISVKQKINCKYFFIGQSY